MRLSASRIRSINRAMARVQASAWSASGRTYMATRPSSPRRRLVSMNAPKFVKIVVIPKEQSRIAATAGIGE